MRNLLYCVILSIFLMLFTSSPAFAELPKWVETRLVSGKWSFKNGKVYFTGTYKLTNKSTLFVITGFKSCRVRYFDMGLLINKNPNNKILFRRTSVVLYLPKYTKEYMEIYPGKSRNFTLTHDLTKYIVANDPNHKNYIDLKLAQGASSEHGIKVSVKFIPELTYVQK